MHGIREPFNREVFVQVVLGLSQPCFVGAMGLAARKMKIALPENVAIDAEVDLGMAGDAHCLQARLNVHVPGVERETAEALAHEAHQTCPYSKATRGNIDVTINVV